jgi:hypothetical protein
MVHWRPPHPRPHHHLSTNPTARRAVVVQLQQTHACLFLLTFVVETNMSRQVPFDIPRSNRKFKKTWDEQEPVQLCEKSQPRRERWLLWQSNTKKNCRRHGNCFGHHHVLRQINDDSRMRWRYGGQWMCSGMHVLLRSKPKGSSGLLP